MSGTLSRLLEDAQAAAFFQTAFFLDLQGSAFGSLGAGTFAGHDLILPLESNSFKKALLYRSADPWSKSKFAPFPENWLGRGRNPLLK